MLNTIRLCCPAKLNIHLKVKEKRSDHFHSIESLFQTVSLCDTIVAKAIFEPKCQLSVEGMSLASKNTITDAYEAFKEHTGIDKGIDVLVKKRIPAGAGLGGGSSNAAGIIQSMNMLFDTRLKEEALLAIAGRVGSDVPFFIKGGAAIVTGRGECIQSIKQRDDLWFVLIFPEVHSSTKEAYQNVDKEIEKGLSQKGPLVEELEAMFYKSPHTWEFINSFSSVLMSQQSLIKKAFSDIEALGALYTQMSGAGSSVFGVFTSEQIAQKTYKNLSKKWKRCYILTSSTVDCC